MSGLSKLLPALFLLLLAVPLHGQGLPDIDRIDVEGLRLIILGKDGKRSGVLSAKTATKSKEGKVRMTGAVLSMKRGKSEFKLEADQFNYVPADNTIEYPKGMKVMLPDGGEITVPAGHGTLVIKPDIILHMESSGVMKFRLGAEAVSTISGKVPEPVLDVTLKQTEDKQELEILVLKSDRGGEIEVKMEHMPIFSSPNKDEDTEAEKVLAVAKINCKGRMKLKIVGEDHLTTLHMQRRVKMDIQSDKENLIITSTTFEVSGKRGTIKTKGAEVAVFTGVSMKASGNVLIEGDRINGYANEMTYSEIPEEVKSQDGQNDQKKYVRVLTLKDQPRLIIKDEEHTPVGDKAPEKRIELNAHESITMRTPAGINAPDEMNLQLLVQGRIQRFVGEQRLWQLYGKRVDIRSWKEPAETKKPKDKKDKAKAEPNYEFSAEASGYAPIIRVHPIESADAAAQLSRATVYGKTASGKVIDGLGKYKIEGSEVLLLSQLQRLLAVQFRKNIGSEDQNNSSEPEIEKSQLVVRANQSVTLEIKISDDNKKPEEKNSDIFRIRAIGQVELDHQPMQRNDSKLVTMTGHDIELHLVGDNLKSAHIHGGSARISVGFDLLSCEQFDIYEEEGKQKSKIQGPGTLTLREPETLVNLRRMLALLPRQEHAKKNGKVPDAGWVDFEGTVTIESSKTVTEETPETPKLTEYNYLLNMLKPRATLVFGEFEQPRPGRIGFVDVAELRDPDVEILFTASAGLLRVDVKEMKETVGKELVDERVINVVSLVSNARIDSKLDGFKARGSTSIVISGTEVKKGEEVPFTVQINQDALLTITKASEFLGKYVDDGIFAYNKQWTLQAGDHLQITTRPLDGLWSHTGSEGNPPSFNDVRKLLLNAEKENSISEISLFLKQARQLLIRATGERQTLIGVPPLEIAQPRKALLDFTRVKYTLHRAQLEVIGSKKRKQLIGRAKGQMQNIRARLGSLIDLSGDGGVRCTFESSSAKVPPMTVLMQAFSLTFSGSGGLVGTDISGPVVLRREGYTIRGSDVEGHFNGTLKLKDAQLELPVESRIEVEGMDFITVRQRETGKERTSGGRAVRRTVITRITGKKLKVKISLVEQE